MLLRTRASARMSVPESKLYEQFVDRTLSEVALGLQLDNAQAGSKKRKVHDALVRRSQTTSGTRGAAQKIIESRFILGGDDASYLASGLACLWSTVGAGGDGNGADALTLAPASLYAPDAVNGIRQGLLRALERRNAETQIEAPKRLPMLMRLLGTIVDFVPDVPTATARMLSTGTVRNAKEREMLLAFLRELKAIMTDASDSLSDPETSLARRIINGARAGSRASMQRIRRLDEAERANDRLLKQYNEALAEWEGKVTAEREAYNEQLKKMEARFEAGRALALSAAVNDKVRKAEAQIDAANIEITKAETEVEAKKADIASLKEQMKVKERELQWQYQQLAQFNMAHAEGMLGVLAGHGFHVLHLSDGTVLHEGRATSGGFSDLLPRPGGGWVLSDRKEHLHLFNQQGRGIRRLKCGGVRKLLGWFDREHLLIHDSEGFIRCIRMIGEDTQRVIEDRGWSWCSRLEEGQLLMQAVMERFGRVFHIPLDGMSSNVSKPWDWNL